MYNCTFLEQYLLMTVVSPETFTCCSICLFNRVFTQLTLKFAKSFRLGTPKYCEGLWVFQSKPNLAKKEKDSSKLLLFYSNQEKHMNQVSLWIKRPIKKFCPSGLTFTPHPSPPAKIYSPIREVTFFGAVEPWVYFAKPSWRNCSTSAA